MRRPWIRLLGLGLLALLIWQLDTAALAAAIARTSGPLLLAAVALNLPMVLLKSLRWQAFMAPQQIRYPAPQAFLAYFGSIFIGLLTPGRLGEFVKALHVSEDCRVPLARAFSSVLVDRLFDLYALLAVGGLALLSLAGGAGAPGLALLLGALTLPLLLFLDDRLFSLISRAAGRAPAMLARLFAPGSWLLELRRSMRQLTAGWLLAGVVLTAASYAIFFGQCYLLALGAQVPSDFVSISYAVAIGSLVTLLPISISGLGTREAAIVAYLGARGVQPETALTFSLLLFLAFYVGGGLIGALAWWVKPAPMAIGSLRKL